MRGSARSKGLCALGIGALILLTCFCPPEVLLVIAGVALVVLGIAVLNC